MVHITSADEHGHDSSSERISRRPDLMTPKEVAVLLKVPISTIYYLIGRGQLPAFRIGSSWRLHRNLLTHYQVIVNLAIDKKNPPKYDILDITRHGGYFLQRKSDENTDLFLTTSPETDLSALGLQAHFSGLVIHVLEDGDIPEMGQGHLVTDLSGLTPLIRGVSVGIRQNIAASSNYGLVS